MNENACVVRRANLFRPTWSLFETAQDNGAWLGGLHFYAAPTVL